MSPPDSVSNAQGTRSHCPDLAAQLPLKGAVLKEDGYSLESSFPQRLYYKKCVHRVGNDLLVLGLGKVVREEIFERRLTSVYVGFREGKRRQRQEGLQERRDGLCRDKTVWDCMAGLGRRKQFNPWRPGRMGLLLPQTLATLYPFTGIQGPPWSGPCFPLPAPLLPLVPSPSKSQPSGNIPHSFSLVAFGSHHSFYMDCVFFLLFSWSVLSYLTSHFLQKAFSGPPSLS